MRTTRGLDTARIPPRTSAVLSHADVRSGIGNFEHLVALLDPDFVLRADGGALASASRVVRGAKAVAGHAATFSKWGLSNQIVLVNGNVGLLERRPDGQLFAA